MHSVVSSLDHKHHRQVQRPLPVASRIRVVSLLDQKHYQQVKDLWAELARKFGVRGIYVSPRPHITYQIATCYEVKSLESVLQRFAASKTSFKVRTGGLGIFTGPQPILYIPVVRSPELTQFHEALWQEIFNTGSSTEDHYHPTRWVPHITIGIGDMNKRNLSQIIRFLVERDFNWEITIDTIVLVHNLIVPHFGFILRKLSPKVYGTNFSHFPFEEGDTGIAMDGQATTDIGQFMIK
jgi:2'-5' RNA ligase